ncbi:BBE domain-containing protein [Streptomyces sp. NPDC093984]
MAGRSSATSSRARRRSFVPDDWQRLQSLKATYDPDGVFWSCLSPEDASP